ncbi:MAG: hypothetical protein WC798_03580 [Candidatus Paceibacterota bacterium]|jgi:hypothetical protein
MKTLFFGIVFILIVGIGGFLYRNALELPTRPIACPLDARVCPDGTSVARTGTACTFAECLSPNVSLPDIGVAFALPSGFVPTTLPDAASVVAYETPAAGSVASIVIRRYAIEASSTALATIQKTAIRSTSGEPVGATSFSSTLLGTHRFTVVSLGRFEGVVETAYYLARTTDVVRFDAIDRGVTNWTDPNLDTTTLPAARALGELLTTLQGQ